MGSQENISDPMFLCAHAYLCVYSYVLVYVCRWGWGSGRTEKHQKWKIGRVPKAKPLFALKVFSTRMKSHWGILIKLEEKICIVSLLIRHFSRMKIVYFWAILMVYWCHWICRQNKTKPNQHNNKEKDTVNFAYEKYIDSMGKDV